MRYILAFLCVLAHTAMAEVPADRLRVLERGVNLTDVFSDKSVAALQREINDVKHAGFRHIRFFIDPAWVWRPGEPAHLDAVVQAAYAARLGIIICMQSYVQPFNASQIESWTTAWAKIANHFANSDPELLFFELINEPPAFPEDQWTGMQEVLRLQVRKLVPQHTLLLTGSPTSTSYALAALPPSPDANVAYVFHEYQPMVFTHQGAEWAEPFDTVRGLQYPPNEINLQIIEDTAASSLKNPIEHYAKLGRDVIIRDVKPAVEWAQRNHRPVIVTEFGVYRRFAPLASRAAWLHDTRVILEQHGIGWTVWEYNGGFGIKPELDLGCSSQLSKALDLCH